MNRSIAFIRFFFFFLSILFMTAYTVGSAGSLSSTSLLSGAGLGLLVGMVLLGLDMVFQQYDLRSFNVMTLGLFFGYLMSMALLNILDAILRVAASNLPDVAIEVTKVSLLLLGSYLGVILTMRGSEELAISIPFFKFAPMTKKQKSLILDSSILYDSRLLDLASTGLLDQQIVLPNFVIKELYTHCESNDEIVRSRARRALEVVKKLEALPQLGLRYEEMEFPEVRDFITKLVRLARLTDGAIFTADVNRIQTAAPVEGITIINIHSLSNALKPIMQAGEHLKIKILRYGKEARQGVGYLEDGTMVVVNGGGDFIGEEIRVKVLSVKHTSSGRMIFCNASDEENFEPDAASYLERNRRTPIPERV